MSNLKYIHEAVIYCRVSSAKQVTEGNGMELIPRKKDAKPLQKD